MARKVLVKETRKVTSANSQVPVVSAPTSDEIQKDLGSVKEVKELDLQAVVDGTSEVPEGDNKTMDPQQRKAKLDVLVPAYHQDNALKNQYTNSCKQMGNDIKELLLAGELKTFVSEAGVQATISITPNVEFLEDELLEHCKKLNIPGLVKTKEFVDMDVLEDAIYHGDIDPKTLKPFQVEKPATIRLTTKIPKQKVKA